MASIPTQRSKKHLEENGWQVAIVEKWIPPRGKMEHGRRIDVFGFGDLLACRPLQEGPKANSGIALVQTFPDQDFMRHWRKITGDDPRALEGLSRDKLKKAMAKIQKIKENAERWKASGGLIFLHGWALRCKERGKHGSPKVWKLREEIL